MKFFCFLIFITTLLLSGCAYDIERTTSETKNPQANIQFQRFGTAPQEGAKLIQPAQLQAGDILLSTASGITSVGIRVFSTSAVSHAAIYLGDQQVAEAVGSGVRIISLDDFMGHSRMSMALRTPDFTPESADVIRKFAEDKVGTRYNFDGIILMMPFSITRKICEISPFSSKSRYACLNLMAKVQLGNSKDTLDNTYFCSQFVLEAYNQAGHPITSADPVWVSPGDLLHMREGDTASIPSFNDLLYVGHLKLPGAPLQVKEPEVIAVTN